jgi:hypothetical protein
MRRLRRALGQRPATPTRHNGGRTQEDKWLTHYQ